MNKKQIRYLSIGISFAALSLLGTTPIVVSCSESKSEVVAINAEFAQKKAELQNEFGLPRYEENNYQTDGSKLIENAKNALAKLNEYKQNHKNLSIDETIWLDTYIYNWETEINNWNKGLQYLGGNPSGNALPLNPNSNHLDNNIESAINIYEIDKDTLEPISDKDHIDNDLANNYVGMGEKLKDYICSLKAMLTKGMENGVMPSNITKKLFITQMINKYYKNEIKYWHGLSNISSGISIALPVKADKFEPTNALLKNFDVWKTWAEGQNFKNEDIQKAKKSLEVAQAKLDDFINWYAKTYYTNDKSFGGSNTPLILTTTVDNTQERIIELDENVKLYGTGITEAEREMNDVGIGFMKSTLQINNKTITGNDMYIALLNFNNSVNKTPDELVRIGEKSVKDTISNMIKVAEQVAQINSQSKTDLTWKPEVMYDNDIEDDQEPRPTTMNIYDKGALNFEEFNKWLNQENFFFGRETQFWNKEFTGENGTSNNNINNLDAYTQNGINKDFDKYLDNLNKLGYSSWKDNNNPINGTGSVSGKQALAGAVLSLVSYNDFKKITNDVFDKNFNDIPDYNVAPYNKEIEKIIGVGLEGPRGSNIFNYNVNPYYSLPKWSQSSFQTHEGKMGHHTQQAYWTKYMPNGDGKNGNGPGYVFKQDSFHEGWAVFAEWFANELGIYGGDLDPETRIPKDWKKAKGFVPKIPENNDSKATNDAFIKEMQNFQAGAYWDATSDKYNDNLERAKKAAEIANMLQYYGYLNEAQLRNMRLAVDPLYHYNKPASSAAAEEKNDTPQYGASIKQIRDYLKKNSGLGQGDIQSESYRYLNMPSQATGYMTGKNVFESLFKKVKDKYETENKNSNKDFLSNKNEVKKLFDIMLRNGEIPLQVLIEAVESTEINNK